MLTVKLAVNYRPIAEMKIVRIEGEKHGPCRYRCGLDDQYWEVDHHYNDGAWALVAKAIEQKPTKGK